MKRIVTASLAAAIIGCGAIAVAAPSNAVTPVMDAVRRQGREERLLQISAVKTNARHIRELDGQTRDRTASRSVNHGGFDDRAAVNDRLHETQTFQDAHRIWRKGDAGADFPQLRSALKNFDTKTRLPQSNRSGESADTGANDENV